MVNSESIADVALVISIIALLVTSGQLLSQIFATAEGHRHCQPSVIGNWASLTRRKWRWSSFRFETIVTTPEIELMPFGKTRDGVLLLKLWSSSRNYSGRHSFYDLLSNRDAQVSQKKELVCWIPFLRELKKSMESDQRACYLEGASYLSHWDSAEKRNIQTLPVLTHKSRSWDFMPPEIVRPFASTTVSDIAIIALRMGMSWKVLKPEEGVMEAEGNGHVLSSTLIRSLGTLIRYIRSSGPNFEVNPYFQSQGDRGKAGSFIVETVKADRMWFGILPVNIYLLDGRPLDIFIGDSQSVYEIMDLIDPSLEATKELKSTAPSLFGFNDIIPMLAPWMRQKGTIVNTLPSVTYDVRGITYHESSQNVFYTRLKKHIQDSGYTRDSGNIKEVLVAWDILNRDYPKEWGEFKGAIHTIQFLDALEVNYDKITDCLERINTEGSGYYFCLVKVHLTRATLVKSQAEEAVRKSELNSTVTSGPAWVAEAMNIYWDNMHLYKADMRERGYLDGALVEEMWILSMFRAFLWSRAHEFDNRRDPLPSKYYGSQLPVYIG